MSVEDEKLSVAVDFVVRIISTSMEMFNLSFSEVDKVLEKLGYWETFNNIEVTAVGAHYGDDEILQKIKENI